MTTQTVKRKYEKPAMRVYRLRDLDHHAQVVKRSRLIFKKLGVIIYK